MTSRMIDKKTLSKMVRLALSARDNAYAPSSNHPVGCSVLTASGKFYAGCNCELANYDITCAENAALAAMVNGGILVVVLNRRLGGVEWNSVGRSAFRVLVACLPIVLACGWVANAQVWTHPAEWFEKSAMLCVAIGLSIGGYLGVHALFRSEELSVVWGMVRRKLGRVMG